MPTKIRRAHPHRRMLPPIPMSILPRRSLRPPQRRNTLLRPLPQVPHVLILTLSRCLVGVRPPLLDVVIARRPGFVSDRPADEEGGAGADDAENYDGGVGDLTHCACGELVHGVGCRIRGVVLVHAVVLILGDVYRQMTDRGAREA